VSAPLFRTYSLHFTTFSDPYRTISIKARLRGQTRLAQLVICSRSRGGGAPSGEQRVFSLDVVNSIGVQGSSDHPSCEGDVHPSTRGISSVLGTLQFGGLAISSVSQGNIWRFGPLHRFPRTAVHYLNLEELSHFLKRWRKPYWSGYLSKTPTFLCFPTASPSKQPSAMEWICWENICLNRGKRGNCAQGFR